MSKAYLFIYSDKVGSREEVKSILNLMREITHWRYDMPNSFYLISDSSAQELSEKFRSLSEDKGRFLFTELSGNEQGWLSKESWYLIENKKYYPKKRDEEE